MKKLLTTTLLLLALPSAHALDIQRWRTAEGATVLLVERHENPIVDISVQFPAAGSIADSQGKNGVSDFAAGLLTTGTKKHDEENFNKRINDLAAQLESDNDRESSSLTLRSLSRPATLRQAGELMQQALSQPRYDAEVFRRTRQQAELALRQNESQPGYIAMRESVKLDYPQHPYSAAAYTSVQSLQAVSLDDVKTFHRNQYAKEGAVVALVGDLNRQQADRLVGNLLKGLPEKAQTAAKVPPVNEQAGRRADIPFASEQAQVVMSMPLISRNDPDYYALVAGNYILGGGGFDSRLMKTLRDEHGYVYGVSSNLMPQREKGRFVIQFATQKSQAPKALEAAEAVLRRFIAEGPTEAELQQAKDNIIGSFPLRFDTNQKLLGYLGMIGLYDLPSDWMEQYPKKIEALTVDDVKKAWQRRVKPENLNTVVVGG
mgnify:FL=1